MTSPTDYSQQLQTYVTAWRQLLEALATLASTFPMPSPGALPAPPAPLPPPAPAEYPQQLTGYLHAWRQYLEQATGAPRPPTQPRPVPSTTPREPAAGESGSRTHAQAAAATSTPGDSPSTGAAATNTQSDTSSQTEPPKFWRAPEWQWGGQITDLPALPDLAGRAEARDKGFDVPRPPPLEFGVAPNVRRTTVRRATSANPSVTTSLAAPAASVRSTLFRGLHERMEGRQNG